MKLWARVFIGYFLIVGLAGWFLLRLFVSEVKPGVRDAVEDVMVDSAYLLAELVRDDLILQRLDTSTFAQSIANYRQRPVRATIWGIEKQTLDFRIYITDDKGIIRYDSEGQHQGENYANWRDVARALRGNYGSRSTRENPQDDASGVMYVTAPVRDKTRIIGVVTIAKPSRTLMPIIERGERTIFRQGLSLLAATLLIGGLLTAWLSRSMHRLVRYARALAAGEVAEPPSRGRDEIGELSRALAHLRNEIDGRAYVEHYVQHLTHEMKSPLAAIRGAAELLAEGGLPEADRQRFTQNVETQSERLQMLIDKLLRLAQIEQQRELDAPLIITIDSLVHEMERSFSANAAARQLTVHFSAAPDLQLRGERFLLELALSNLLQNALDFSPSGTRIDCQASAHDGYILISIRDHGEGIADYAHERLFERFFSLPRPNGLAKSTGLGLPLVREIAHLHGGDITLSNAPDGGAIATLRLPAA